jgi:hypothetical protein
MTSAGTFPPRYARMEKSSDSITEQSSLLLIDTNVKTALSGFYICVDEWNRTIV